MTDTDILDIKERWRHASRATLEVRSAIQGGDIGATVALDVRVLEELEDICASGSPRSGSGLRDHHAWGHGVRRRSAQVSGLRRTQVHGHPLQAPLRCNARRLAQPPANLF